MKNTSRLIGLGLLLALACNAYADTKISALPAGSTLAGTEPIPTVQAAATVATTPAAINTYVKATGTQAFDHGGTGQTTAPDDNLIVGNGSGWQLKTLPTCSGATNALSYNLTTNAFGCNTITPGTGTVTSVDLTVPSGFSVTGNPVTTSGTLAISGTLNPAGGGTGVGTLANDSLLMGNGTSAMSAKAIPSCSAGTSALTYNTSTDAWGCNTISAGGSVAGSDTQVQYNNAGAFGASARFTWDNATTTLGIGTSGQQVTLQALPTGGATVSQLNISGGNGSGGGGYVRIQAGTATSGGSPGGDAEMQGGTQLGTGAGGNVNLIGGLTVDGNGGSIGLSARNGAGTNRSGGNVTLTTGTATGSGTVGRVQVAGPLVSTGTKFTASGCSNSATVGGVQAGQFTSGTSGTCTVTITLPAAPNGWVCYATDITTGAAQPQTASTTTSCTVSGATTSTNIVSFMAMGY